MMGLQTPGILFLTLCCVAPLLGMKHGEKVFAFTFLTQDSVQADVYLQLDQNGLPIDYQAYVNTPVCEDDICYNIELKVTWDITGDFKAFDTLQGKPLTKREHEPFTFDDYSQLTKLLVLDRPKVKYLKKDELVLEQPEVDGVSGATVLSVKDEVVPGAAYGSYVLWHIVNGEVKQLIADKTMGLLDERLLTSLFQLDNRNLHLFLIRNFDEQEFDTFLPHVLELSVKSDPTFTRWIFKMMPSGCLYRPTFINFLTEHFNQYDRLSQRAILEKMTDMKFEISLAGILRNHFSADDMVTNSLLVALLCENLALISDESMIQILEELGGGRVAISQKTYYQLDHCLGQRNKYRRLFNE